MGQRNGLDRAKDQTGEYSVIVTRKKYIGDVSCTTGRGTAICYGLGDYEKAYAHLQQVERVNSCGLYYWGRLYDEGHIVGKNPEKAIEYYQSAVKCTLKYEDEYGEDEHSELTKERLREMGAEVPGSVR